MKWVKEKKVSNLTSETTVISSKSKSSPNTQSCFTEEEKTESSFNISTECDLGSFSLDDHKQGLVLLLKEVSLESRINGFMTSKSTETDF